MLSASAVGSIRGLLDGMPEGTADSSPISSYGVHDTCPKHWNRSSSSQVSPILSGSINHAFEMTTERMLEKPVLLQSKDHEDLLNIIDDLRSQTSYHVDLPQIIVCGDQSSGRSSVLQALPSIQFRPKGNLCTRLPRK